MMLAFWKVSALVSKAQSKHGANCQSAENWHTVHVHCVHIRCTVLCALFIVHCALCPVLAPYSCKLTLTRMANVILQSSQRAELALEHRQLIVRDTVGMVNHLVHLDHPASLPRAPSRRG